ncbi:NADH-quinone oxidoreductase subunit M [Serratia sp. OLHL2]|jgi:NADH-quinone oxidoreductase subunit M|uniref:NADH-quinone oxidoreductase subunit M n=4 Tax=Serratia TaxID=613 RepID=A0A9X9C274_9GAMM|nr:MULTISPECIES: NADH-quinone oxidoreductase subunit M [Serratia]KAB5499299.1 NADH-quinone oxidoreductase subunit M [Enterobacter sp. RJAL6]KLE39312.1 NADH:ubiquinone oxidoreductase subunit M [Serratia sp. TEL]WIF07738.1 NADH-quinone oxidoreductase subunit M [Serratia sp. B1]AIM22880.1 NADH:ubiquinone oxidoreductase subunit M [Serratia sp. SCBI]ALD45989.1 NADH:ubiquinone oxidoreductase subunit M [Serratia marcescens]
MLLPWLILIPFIGGLLCWQLERFGTKVPRWIALIAMGLTLALSLQLWMQGGYTLTTPKGIPQWQSEFLLPWIPRFGISIHLALDGLSLLMVVLTGLLGVLAILCSWREIQKYQGFFHLNLLWILGGVIGVFLAIDMFLFFFFWEMMLVPMYFLIALWGHKASDGKTRITAATKFFIYTQASGLVMLIAILGLVFVHYNATGVWTFDYEDLLQTPMSHNVQYMLMLGFFIAFAVKMPVVPLHGWLPDAHSQAPTAGSVDLAGILLKTAAYGLLRFSLPLFPEASHEFAPIAMWLGVIGIFYGAWMAFAQTDIKRLIAYTSVSHMGFVLIAIYTGSQLAYQGAVIQMIAHGLSAAGMFIICGQLYERLHTRDMRQMGGLWGRIKFIPALSLFFAVATLGMPGTGNFVGEFMILFGSYQVVPVITVISTFGLVFASVYSLIMMQRAYYGAPKSDQPLQGMTARELFIILLLVVLLVLLGVYPQPILDTSNAAMSNVQHWFGSSVSAISTTRP